MRLRYRDRHLLVPLLMVPLLLLASCGDSDDESAPNPQVADLGANSPDPSDSDSDSESDRAAGDDSDDDQQVVCNLLSDDEIAEATGFEVVAAEGDTFGLPMCEWELAIPESSGVSGLPFLQIVLLAEGDYRMRVDPLLDSLHDIDGPADEMKLHFVGGGDTDIPAMVSFFALNGNQGFSISPGNDIWNDQATATSALVELADKLFDRM